MKFYNKIDESNRFSGLEVEPNEESGQVDSHTFSYLYTREQYKQLSQDNLVGLESKYPILVLPKDEKKISLLKTKKRDYEQRVEHYQYSAPESPQYQHYLSSVCKLTLVKKLIEKGEVDTQKILGNLEDKLGENVEIFEKAIAIIEDYCVTGDEHIIKNI